MLWGEIEESEKAAVARSQTQDTSGLSHQCSATEPQQLDIQSEKTTQHGFFPDGESFLVDP